MEIVKVNKKGDDLFINFNELLGTPRAEVDLTNHGRFMIKKRSFKNRVVDLKDKMNYLIEHLELVEKDFLHTYLALSTLCKSTSEPISKYVDVTNQLIDILEPKVHHMIDTEVDPEAYRVRKDLEEINSVDKRELYFSTIHLKRILAITIYSKFFYLMMNPLDLHPKGQRIKTKITELIWNRPYCEGDKSNMINKIQKVVSSRILNTIYSDKRFWNVAKLHDINPFSQANKMTNKIVTEAIAVLDWDVNPIPFIDVYLKNNIQWLTKKSFNVNYNVVNTYQQDKKFDLQEKRMQHIDTNSNFLSNFLVNEDILRFLNTELGNQFSTDNYFKELYNLINDKFVRNDVHFYILFPLISKKLNISIERLLLIDKPIFVAIIVYTIKVLSDNNFLLLCNLLLSNINNNEKAIEKLKIDSLKTLNEVKNSKVYLETIKTKYKFFSDIIVEEDYIVRIVAFLYYNKFISFYNEKTLDFSIKDISDEYLRFLNTML